VHGCSGTPDRANAIFGVSHRDRGRRPARRCRRARRAGMCRKPRHRRTPSPGRSRHAPPGTALSAQCAAHPGWIGFVLAPSARNSISPPAMLPAIPSVGSRPRVEPAAPTVRSRRRLHNPVGATRGRGNDPSGIPTRIEISLPMTTARMRAPRRAGDLAGRKPTATVEALT
jgi:hypothetical protein